MFSEQPFEQKRLAVSGVLFSTSTIFFQLMLLIILFYLAGSLFDDRKDRSILFWKSCRCPTP
jgi:ABC-2 type transport system permease protein